MVDGISFYIINTILISVPLLFALFYPKITDILGMVGAVAGFFIIYIIPTSVHMKKMKIDLENKEKA